MTIQFPVHEDDREALMRIRRYLIGYRITNGWTQYELSHMINGSTGMVHDLESNETWQWRLSRLQEWMIPFGLRLTARTSFRSRALNKAVHAHPEVAPLYQLSCRDGDAWPMWQRAYLTASLLAARKSMGVSARHLARLAGVTRKAVTNWENTADEIMLPKVLHYARLLGGWIELDWE